MTAPQTNPRSADERVLSALRSVELAQSELYAAMSKVSSVLGLAPEWEALGKEADRVKALWHKLHGKYQSRDTWTLDTL